MSNEAFTDYIRIAALGDSASCGVGDPTPEGWRGWARILADALGVENVVSFWNCAVPGATASDVLMYQLATALQHRPHVASLVVGLNDVMRAGWDPARVREDLLECAEVLAREGTLLITVRYHDHTRVLGLPEVVARHMRERIDVLNEIYDELHNLYGVIRIDLAEDPVIYDRALWSLDRLHPSELGHRWLARRVGDRLQAEGLAFRLPTLECTSPPASRREMLRTIVQDVLPWVGRRFRDFGAAGFGAAADRVRAAGITRALR